MNGSTAGDDVLVEMDNCEIVYNQYFLACQGISVEVETGDVVALIGPNGAGKSTILKMISGIGQLERGNVRRGTVYFDGEDVTNASASEMVERDVTHVLEDRHIFETLTVEENLRCGLYRNGKRFGFDPDDYDIAFEYFPRLEERLDTKAGYISGGEQQMLVIARALLHDPRLLILDEPSLGLAPQLVDGIFETIRRINREEDVTLMVADQNVDKVLDIADYGYVMENGQIKLHAPADDLMEREEIKEFFTGHGDDDPYSDIKHYKITKRWV
jgi:branched-chain amino acid transport system ATP-binding protein